MNFQEPFPIQAAAIPVLLSGQDVIGQAHTGTGKTAAFSLPILGGQSINVQFRDLDRGVEIVVATPGRLIDHLKRGSIELNDVKFVVLDEADTMLDMGFIDDIKFILDLAPERKITALFSATMPAEILRLAEKY